MKNKKQLEFYTKNFQNHVAWRYDYKLVRVDGKCKDVKMLLQFCW